MDMRQGFFREVGISDVDQHPQHVEVPSGDHCFMVAVWFSCLCCVFGCWPSLLCSVLAIYYASAASEAEAELNVQEVKRKERMAVVLNCAAAVTASLMAAVVVTSGIIYRYFGNR